MPHLKSLQFKASTWHLAKLESRLKDILVPRVPTWLHTHHLTLCTIPCILIALCIAYFAQENRFALIWLSPLVIIQYICDLLDGEVGRRRQTGLIRWGFYTDHLLDYLFISSIATAYYGAFPLDERWILFVIMIIIGAFFVSTYLEHGATGKFVISEYGFGPTEGRLFFVLINIFFAATEVFVATRVVFAILTLSVVIFIITAYRKQKQLWKADKPYIPSSNIK
jgi:phosphatidylglycerophosphate synthase